MKQFIFSALMIVIAVSAYSYGQAAGDKRIKPCCCEHTQQIAEDLRWIRETMSKPFVGKEHQKPDDPGDPIKLDFTPPKPAKPNYNKR